MSGDIQPRKRKGKGKKKDEVDDEITDAKSKAMANHSSKSHSTSSSDSSGVVAKIIFLILLISLSVVIGLILVELRGKQAGMTETVTVVPGAEDTTKEEEYPAPEIPSANIDIDEEIIPEAPSPVLQHEVEEEYEPIEATPPLEEYVQVVEKVIVEVPPPEEEQVIEEKIEPTEITIEADVVDDDVAPIEEVVEDAGTDEVSQETAPIEVAEEAVEEAIPEGVAEEDAPVEVVEIVEVVEEVIPVEEVVEEVTPVEEVVEEVTPVEEVEEIAPVEVVEKVTPVEEVVEIVEVIEEVVPVDEVLEEVTTAEETAQVEESVDVEEVPPVEVETAQVEEKVEESIDVEEVPPVEVETAQVEEKVEETIDVEEVPPVEVETAQVEEKVEAIDVEEVPPEVETAQVDAPVEVAEEVVDDAIPLEEVVEVSEAAASVDIVEEPTVSEVQEEEPTPVTGESIKEAEGGIIAEEHEAHDDDKEKDISGAEVGQEAEEQEEDWSQYGKEGGAEALNDAYLQVEALADEVLKKDPDNVLVAQLAPHLSEILHAMKRGQTEGLLDTLSHIQVLLEDAMGRLKEKEPSEHLEVLEDTQPPLYEKADITSEIDNDLREELDAAEELLPRNPREALNSFGAILHHNPKSARALYGRARSLDQLAEGERSNSRLEQAIKTYRELLDLADEDSTLVPLSLLRMAAERCIDRLIFRGFLGKALRVQQRLLQRFPDDVMLRNKMGVTFLLMNQGPAAKEVFETILQKWPDNGFAQVHYGYILKTTYNNNTGGAMYMRKGIESGAEGTEDERFYFHLGDALQRQGKTKEAYEVYDLAVEKGLFLNRYQRSLYNVDRLTSQPYWTPAETTYQKFFRKLEENWKTIRDEGIKLLELPPQDGFRPEAENLRDTGDWKQYELFSRGRKITANCVKAPKTCSLIEDFPPAAGCKRGQVKYSVMLPNTHVHAHTGPTNCRLRAHLGLVVPAGLHLRIGNEMTTWQEGKILIFDDSWEHEVWHEGDSYRLVLIVDVWHPELTEHERRTLAPI